MQLRLKKLIAPALLSLCFIFFTAIIAQSEYSMSPFGRFCFAFHTIPYQIGFSGAETYFVYVYYPVLWIVLTGLFAWVVHLGKMIFKKKN